MLWICGLRTRKEHKEKYRSRTSTKSTNDESSNDEDDTGELVFDLEVWFKSNVDESDEEILNLDDWDSDANDNDNPFLDT